MAGPEGAGKGPEGTYVQGTNNEVQIFANAVSHFPPLFSEGSFCHSAPPNLKGVVGEIEPFCISYAPIVPSQDVPHFCLMLTLLLVSADRHSAIVRDARLIPMRWAVALAWALSVGLVLPYSAYIKYIDLSVSETRHHNSE